MKTSELGQRIRQIRLERGMTQDQLAEGTFSKSYISAIELGKIKPSLTALSIIAQRLQVPMVNLVSSSVQIRQEADETLTLRRATLLAKIDGQAQAALELLQTIEPETASARAQKLLAEGQALFQLGQIENAAYKLDAARQMLNQPSDGNSNLPERALGLLNQAANDDQIENLLLEAESLLAISDLATQLASRRERQ